MERILTYDERVARAAGSLSDCYDMGEIERILDGNCSDVTKISRLIKLGCKLGEHKVCTVCEKSKPIIHYKEDYRAVTPGRRFARCIECANKYARENERRKAERKKAK